MCFLLKALGNQCVLNNAIILFTVNKCRIFTLYWSLLFMRSELLMLICAVIVIIGITTVTSIARVTENAIILIGSLKY